MWIWNEWRKLGGMCFILVGVFLILEHIYSYGGVDLFDILGHEWFGLILIVLGFLLNVSWRRLKEGWKHTKDKFNLIFRRNK